MGLNISSKVINKDKIRCDETFLVTLGLSASPDIKSNPTDIVLLLDRSGSMKGEPLNALKLAAKKFVDIIDETTDGVKDGNIGNGSKIGIVSFAANATIDSYLTSNVNSLKMAIDNITAASYTNHSDAFQKGMSLFDSMSNNPKIIIMFTDGMTTIGSNPSIDAKQARDKGIIIYCVGLIGSDGLDISALNNWATEPANAHVTIAPKPADLENLFEDLAQNISKTGATNIVINEILNPKFNIVNIINPNIGSASLINNTTLRWVIPELGKTNDESASLSFEVRYIGDTSGKEKVNSAITYVDNEGNIAKFEEPEISVNCPTIIEIDPCQEPQNVVFESCNTHLEYDLTEHKLDKLGHILDLNLVIKNVCPRQKVGLAVTLHEIDEFGVEQKKSMKIISVPPHNSNECQDINLKKIRFVLPEENNNICRERKFVARVSANYLENNPIC